MTASSISPARLEVAREGALGLLEQVGHQLATPTARARFLRIITELGNGKALTVRGRAELLFLTVGATLVVSLVLGLAKIVIPDESEHKLNLLLAFIRYLERRAKQRERRADLRKPLTAAEQPGRGPQEQRGRATGGDRTLS
ncbi:hypothetical protein [Streptomyces sp. NBC_00645]|uniref:hypothetical protein n=1 Tax=Streptomyces sp. NBC_00645 TaxID=2975795 RepID=UPI0032528DA8